MFNPNKQPIVNKRETVERKKLQNENEKNSNNKERQMIGELSYAFSKEDLKFILNAFDSGETNNKIQAVVDNYVDFGKLGFSESKKYLLESYLGKKEVKKLRSKLKKSQPIINNAGTQEETIIYPKNYWEEKKLLKDIFGEYDTVHTTNEVIEK